MTTAATATRPAPAAPQLPLEGLPPALDQARVAIVGYLQRQGELRTSTDGRAHLVVQVLQPRDGLAFVAVYHAPAGEPRADIEFLAARLKPGTSVVITGNGLELERLGDHQVLRVLKCDRLCVARPELFFADACNALIPPQPTFLDRD